jgi:hypothetical protein
MRLHNSVIMIFEIAPEEFRPSFCTREVNGKTYTTVDEWCSGLLQGIALAGDAWQTLLDKKPGAWLRPVPRELQESLRWDAMRLAPVGAGRNTNTAVVPLAHCIDSTSGNA